MSESATADLRRYVLARQAVTELVRSVAALSSDPDSSLAVECRALLARLAESRFNLAVVGQFKRGKSTLLNAIVGRAVLPAGAIPLTSAITSLTYGPRDRVLLRWRGRTYRQEIPLGQLADFVTERGNPGNERGLEEAIVEVPSPALRRGVWFIDTPGVGSSDEANSTTTLRFLPEASAVIFVTSADAPLGEVEERFLRDVQAHVRKLLVVVNKVDLLDADERDELLAFVRSRLAPLLGGPAVPVHAVSAAEALAARMDGDDHRLDGSGLPAFESALTRFLADEQGRIFLAAILDRLLAAMDRGSVEGGRDDRDGTRWADVRGQVAAARDELADSRSFAAAPWISIVPATVRPADGHGEPAPAAGPRRPVPSAQASCPVCAAQGEALFSFLAHWQYALSRDAATRATFAAGDGLCPAHTWQFQQIASPLTLALAYAPLVDRMAAALDREPPPSGDGPGRQPPRGPGGIPALQTGTPCPACDVLRATASDRARALAADWATPEGRSRLRAGHVLCLPHLDLVLRGCPGRVRDALVGHEVQRLEELSEEMHAYALKREAVRRGLIDEREETAPRRAIAMLVGERVVSAPGLAVRDEL